MKMTFELTATNKKDANHVDSIKHKIKKYIARERRKKTPENVDFWTFDCKIGEDDTKTSTIHVSEINSIISGYSNDKKESFYIEIMAKPGTLSNKK